MKNMKRGIGKLAKLLLALLALTFVTGVLPFGAAYEENLTIVSDWLPGVANIQIASLKYEPYPVEPGEQFELWIKIQNMGGKEAEDARCRLVLDMPFLIYQGEIEKSYGILGSKDFAVFKYKLRVDEDAVEGDNELVVECTDDPAKGLWVSKKLNIKVQTRYATLNIKNVRTSPAVVEPGQKALLLVTLENLADSSMKDIDVRFDFSSVPLAPFEEMGEQKMRRLNAASIADLMFNIIALPDADGGIYKLPVTIEYTDELGAFYSVNGTIAIMIGSEPDLDITVDSTMLSKGKRTGEVVLKIVNKGLTDIKFLNLELLESKDYKIISSSVAYIGDVDSDDFETAEFRIGARAANPLLKVKLDYRDVNNNLFSEEADVELKIFSGAELGTGKSLFSWLITLLVIAVIIYFAYKKRKVIPGIKNIFK